jgi:hypothetical protein
MDSGFRRNEGQENAARKRGVFHVSSRKGRKHARSRKRGPVRSLLAGDRREAPPIRCPGRNIKMDSGFRRNDA